MTNFDVQTISDKEAAERLGFPLRHIRKVLDERGLCMKVNRSRRLTAAQFQALIAALTAEPRKVYQPSTKPPAVRATAASDHMARVRALAAESKREKRKGRKRSGPRGPSKAP